LEHLVLQRNEEGIQADGLVIRHHNGSGLRVQYQIEFSPNWEPRNVRLQSTGSNPIELRLQTDGSGNWFDSEGQPIEALTGCYDVDVMATPFTNTPAIKRLNLAPGGASEIDVVFIVLPELSTQRARQRYTCLERGVEESRYLYENLDSNFKAELVVDREQLVTLYQGQWERIG
jgi:hypothetical protein